MTLLSALRSAAAADRMQAGEAVFAPPDGWAVKEQANGVVKIVSPEENAVILVMPADRFDGDLEQGFAATWEALRTADVEFVQPSVFEDVRQVYMVLSE